MEKIVLISNEVIVFLNKLVLILHNNEYFGFEEDAHKYVTKLENAIKNDLPILTHHITPNKLSHYGNYYVKIKGSKRTTWYVFFEQMKNRFLVQFITNNHTPHSEFLNEL